MKRIPARPLALALAVAAAALAPRAAAAQGRMTSRDAGDGPTRVISINPLGLLFSSFQSSLEFEQTVNGNVSRGLAGSYVDWPDNSDNRDDFRYVLLDGKVRLYPQERAPDGLSVGLTVGYAHVTDKDHGCRAAENCPDEVVSENALTTGLELDYTRLLGSSRGFAVSGGVGGRRLYPVGGSIDDARKVIPVVRFSIGLTFR